MVYESDFYTRRSYTRPSVSSYTVSYPIYRYSPFTYRYPYYPYYTSSTYRYPYYPYYTSSIYRYPYYPYYSSSTYKYPYYPYYSSSIYRYPTYRYTPSITREYSYPIYSYHSIPYVAHKRLISGTRVLSSPSPVRVIRTTRIVRSASPVRVITSPIRYLSPIRDVVSSVRVITSPPRYIRESSVDVLSTVPSFRTPRSVFARELDRIAHKIRPRIGYYPLENYLNSESFINFDSEARKIRSSAQSLLREIHTPVPRRARSATPFPITRYYDSTPNYALKAYVSRVTDPLHNIASDVNSLLNSYSDQRKYTGKSHLASVRILGDRGYNIRNALYDPDVVKTDIEYLSHYLRNRQAAKEKSPQLVRHLSVEAVEA